MASKVKLGNRPKAFKPFTIDLELPDGEKGEIPITFKYKTQDEYWEYRDSFFKAIGVERPDKADTNLPVIAKEARMRAAEHMVEAIDDWGLDIPLSADALCDLFNEIPRSAGVLVEAYQRACTEGRLGN